MNLMKAKPGVLAVLLAAAAGCPSSPPPRPDESRDFATLHSMMGVNQKLVFSLQSHVGDPPERDAIRSDLEKLAGHFEAIQGLRPYDDEDRNQKLRGWSKEIARQMREIRDAEWKAETRKELFQKVTTSCTKCHGSFPYSRVLPPMAFDHAAMTRVPSSRSCGKCHTEVLDEWKGTLHATAWEDPLFVTSAGKPMKMECKSCHSPQPILFTDLAQDWGYRPYLRDFNHADSINCVSCHLRGDGSVAARQDVPGAPCRPTRDPRLSSPLLCGTCHNPTHDANFEWERSAARKAGLSCNGCHSQVVYRTGADGKKKAGFSHVFPGGNDPAFVAKAIKTDCSIRNRELTVRVENRTAHKFPGEVPTRIFLVRIQFWDGDGTLIREDSQMYRRPGKGEVGWKDNRFEPDEVKSLVRPLPEKTAKVKADFLFQNGPFAVFDKAFTIARWETEVK
jgi:cytochrome c554/c'-like protein